MVTKERGSFLVLNFYLMVSGFESLPPSQTSKSLSFKSLGAFSEVGLCAPDGGDFRPASIRLDEAGEETRRRQWSPVLLIESQRGTTREPDRSHSSLAVKDLVTKLPMPTRFFPP